MLHCCNAFTEDGEGRYVGGIRGWAGMEEGPSVPAQRRTLSEGLP